MHLKASFLAFAFLALHLFTYVYKKPVFWQLQVKGLITFCLSTVSVSMKRSTVELCLSDSHLSVPSIIRNDVHNF